jgi:hypothetical protein
MLNHAARPWRQRRDKPTRDLKEAKDGFRVGSSPEWRSGTRAAREALHVLRQLTTLVILTITLVVGSTTAISAAGAVAPDRVTANCSPGIPEKDCQTAAFVYRFVVSHGYTPPRNLKGGKRYENNTGLLPSGGDYLEYRLYQTPGSSERLVIDRNNPEGNSWFTNIHYKKFTQFYLTL